MKYVSIYYIDRMLVAADVAMYYESPFKGDKSQEYWQHRVPDWGDARRCDCVAAVRVMRTREAP